MTLQSASRTFITSIITGAVFCTVLAGVSPANAAEGPGAQAGTEQKLLEINETASRWEALSSGETDGLRHAWAGDGRHSASGLEVDLAGAEGFETQEGRVLRIPFGPAAGVLPESNLSVVVDTSGHVVASSELVLTQRTADSGRVQSWTDGVLRVDRVVEASESVVNRANWWGRFTNCLNSKGVAAWAVTALTIACSAICIATVGTGCLVCLGAASAVTSGTITYCVGKANQG